MFTLTLLFIFSFGLSLLFTPLVRNFCVRLGYVDKPDQARKIHKLPIPRVGGVAILLACGGAVGLLMLTPLQGAALVRNDLPLIWRLAPALLVIFATGLVDDIIGLRPWQKLIGQLGGAGMACWAEVHIHAISGRPLEQWIAIPITLLWMIGCTNAFNLIDGLDGLATGVGLFATLTTFVAALLSGHMTLAFATIPLVGALCGFLRYNFNPASIFLGDCGSMTIGFLLGCYGIIWSEKSATLLGMTAPLMALAIPLLDTALAIVRRFLRGTPIFGADRGHIHHRLLDRGITPRRAALMLYGICGMAAMFSLLQSMAHNEFKGLIIVLFCGATWIGVQHLGYIEFGMAGRLILPGRFLRVLQSQIRLRTLDEELKSAQSVDECFAVIREACPDFGFSHVILCVDGTIWEHPMNGSARNAGWILRIPLAERDFVNFTREFDRPNEPMVVAAFASVLRNGLSAFANEPSRVVASLS